MQLAPQNQSNVLERALIGTLLFLVLLLLGVQVAKAGELIPGVGLSQSVHDSGDQAKVYGNLALRGPVLPILKVEVAVSYRSETRFDGLLHERMWPVTGSLYLTPIPAIYAGAGVGWYPITFDYDQSRIPFAISDHTDNKFGVHLGGGVDVPIAPALGLDIGGRYVMLQDQNSKLVPEKFNPDFWTATAGLAFKF